LRRAPGSDADPALGVAGSASVRAALRWHECYWQRQYVVMMRQSRGSVAGSALTDLVLEVFRLNGRLLAAGERMTRPSGQTSARWQSSAPSPRAAHCRTDCPSHGRGWQSPVVVRKKRRMRLIAANGLGSIYIGAFATCPIRIGTMSGTWRRYSPEAIASSESIRRPGVTSMQMTLRWAEVQ
jgi:hypothetical protein